MLFITILCGDLIPYTPANGIIVPFNNVNKNSCLPVLVLAPNGNTIDHRGVTPDIEISKNIDNANTAYNNLTDDQKALVVNYDKLVEANTDYNNGFYFFKFGLDA